MSAARAKKKPQEEFNLFDALKMLEKEKGIPVDYMIEKIQTAIAQAIKKDPFNSENSVVEIDPETGRFYVALRKDVVEEVEDPTTQISVEDAAKYQSGITAGSVLEVALDPKKFGRIAAQAAKSSIHQGIREAEKGLLLKEYESRQHDIVSAKVLRVDPVRGNVTLEIGSSEAVLPKTEQIPDETFTEGQRIKVYVVDVQNTEKGPRLMISRTHPGLVKRLFEMNVPEIYDGTVEIRSIAREAGSRSKLAVSSRDENVDAIGAPRAPVSIPSWRSWAAKRSMSSITAMTPPPTFPRRFLPPPFWAWRSWMPIPTAAASPCRITSSRSPSAIRARTPAWRPA